MTIWRRSCDHVTLIRRSRQGVSVPNSPVIYFNISQIHEPRTMPTIDQFDSGPILRYLVLDTDYRPSPDQNPIEFLKRHMSQLPPHLLVLFKAHPEATPRARASVAAIRNRRCNYAATDPKALDPDALSETDVDIWDLINEERARALTTKRPPEQQDEDVADERTWANNQFQDGEKMHVGKIGELLAELEGERKRERERAVRRQVAVARAREEETVEEEEESSDEEEKLESIGPAQNWPDPAENNIRRTIRERFISGLLPVSLCQ
jgi:hypothetical protein